MNLRLGGIRHAMNALYLILFLTGSTVTAQEVGDNSRAQPAVKLPVERTEGKPDASISPDPVVSTRIEKETTGEESAEPNNTERSRPDAEAVQPLAASGLSASANGMPASQSGVSDKWHFQFSPYLFLASLKGTAGVGGLTADVDARFSDIIKDLNFGFMAVLEARKNRFIFLNDLVYMNLADSQDLSGPLFSSVKTDLKAFILDPEVGYRLVESDGGSLDVLGGIRYWHLSTRLEFRPGLLAAREVDGSRNWVDAVAGLRGKAQLSPRWFLTGKADVGGGGSHLTFQLFGGIGANVGKRAALVFGYRYLDVDYDKDGFIFDMAIKGPILGFSFRF